MKKTYFAFLILIAFNSYSQIKFEKGYYIKKDNQKIECLIKNLDWRNNPNELEYKVSDQDEVKTLSVNFIKEFGIYNECKFVEHSVDIDRSSENINILSNNREPIFKNEVLLLKVLVEGKANLYSYVEGNLFRYFYSLDNNKIEQLVFKSYIIDEKYGENNKYKQQLLNELKCDGITLNQVERLEYKKNSLTNFFKKFNSCTNSDYKTFGVKEKKDLFNLNVRGGINRSSLELLRGFSKTDKPENFGAAYSFRFGIEAEYIFGFNKNKWALIFEPTYQSYKSEIPDTIENLRDDSGSVNYQSFEFPIGLRHYVFLSETSKLFLNASVVLDFNKQSNIKSGRYRTELEIDSSYNLAFGLGYKFNDRYSIELRQHTNRNLLNYVYYSTNYNTSSLILGYTLF